jgi:cytochrome c oxidase subunit 2
LRGGLGLHDGILHRSLRCVCAGGAGALTAACEGPLSVLDAAGPSARAIAEVWWWMLGVACVVSVGVVLAWLLALRRGRGALAAPAAGTVAGTAGDADADADADVHGHAHADADADADRTPAAGRRWIIGGGIVLPTLAITALLVWGTPAGHHQLPWRGGAAPALTVQATGHQWWWELHYPGSGVSLRDELRLPAGRPVDVQTTSADVIHSFWVPRLGGKLDALPGQQRVLRLQADAPGVYLGQCAEFCGLGHARMPLRVVVMEPAAFDAWLAAAATAAAAAATSTAATAQDPAPAPGVAGTAGAALAAGTVGAAPPPTPP